MNARTPVEGQHLDDRLGTPRRPGCCPRSQRVIDPILGVDGVEEAGVVCAPGLIERADNQPAEMLLTWASTLDFGRVGKRGNQGGGGGNVRRVMY